MIKYVKITNINNMSSIDAEFNKDVNIITGKNGCGKTTALKIIWYATSSNLERLFHECKFKHLFIDLDIGRIEIIPHYNEDDKKPEVIAVNAKVGKENYQKEIKYKEYEKTIEELNHICLKCSEPTVMFPTFRRIEGGFTLNTKDERYIRSDIDHYSMQVQHGLEQTASMLGVRQHKFVTSISTRDLRQYVTNAYADISKSTNRLHERLKIKLSEILDEKNNGTAEDKLLRIQNQLNEISSHQERRLKPFSVLSDLVAKLFNHRGIKLTDGMKFGDSNDMIDSDILSSGEKQMLSFLCYNAFTKDSIIIIDEPELSLHIDWQRILVDTLIEQNSSNQFIMATHSPMIYGKYADKEIAMKGAVQ